MDNSYRIGKLTQALAAANMTGASDPCQTAAKTIRQTLHETLRALPAWDPAADLAIEDAVRGGLQALIRADLDVARGGLPTLREVSDLAQEFGRDPSETLMSALRGMASVQGLIPNDQLHRLCGAIEASYVGGGEALADLLRAGAAPPNVAPYAA